MASQIYLLLFNGLSLWAGICCVLAILQLSALLPQSLVFPLNVVASPAIIVSWVTPALVPVRLHLLLAAFWLWTLRTALFMYAGAFGLLPSLTQ